MIPLGSSFSSQGSCLTSSQWAQNSVSNPTFGFRRVTVRQLLDAINTNDYAAPFQIHGFPVKRVMLVANVYLNEPHSSSGLVRYGFDDGSGKIMGNRWPEKEGDPPFEAFGYVRAFGDLSRFNGSNFLKVYNIQPIHDAHEIYYHILHAMVDALSSERGPPPPIMHKRKPLTPVQLDLLTCISDRTLHEDEQLGINLEVAVQQMRNHHPQLTAIDFWSSIEFLLDEGLILSIDDNHYKCT
ncbi:hypothetical protein M413DRAFT_438499 [Hebeloma cylindrosporum]|uniref:Replication protein A C-terminal domain-containing protein n=1 Tax=Hebeloma cylindrosporum TaxID=76867 RepID=A0A0C2Z834_HEBCY|nr:hypothetical protein M413DRAFT_438499 [Hebeloma cylindrosporum h7]